MTPRDTDGRRMLVVGLVLLAFAAAGLLTFVAGWRPSAGPWRGDLLETSVSPSGRWEAKAFELNPGAMAHEHMRVQVRDLDDPVSEPRTIYLEDGLGALSWSGPDTLVVIQWSVIDKRWQFDVASAKEVYVGPNPWTGGAVVDFLWWIVVGPLTLVLALLGALLTVAGSSPRAKRTLFGPRQTAAASRTVDQA